MEGQGPDGLDGLADMDVGLPTFVDLTPFEVEHFVESLEELRPEDVGGPRWLTQHERIEKLNWTAHSQAKEGHDEYVIDQFNTLGKIPILIYDLILIEVWKERIWPTVKPAVAKFSSLRSYIPVYHEASCANLLEVCLFHRTSCEEASDALVDLADFCIRKLRYLLSAPNKELVRQVKSAKETLDWDDVRVLDEQFCECEFTVCMCAISILRFMTDHRVAMPLAVTTRLLETHDVLMLLVPLMEKAPWVRRNAISGRIEKFEDQKWEVVEENDEGRLPKLHTQVWLAIYNLLMDPECRARYELTSFRRDSLLRLRRFLNEVVVDQLPPLSNLHRTLEEMSLSGQLMAPANTPSATPFLVELVAEARERLIQLYDGRWQEVAEQQIREVFVKETPDELMKLSQMISIPPDMIDDPGPQPFRPADGEADLGEGAGAAWEALLGYPLVRSTASFFAAAKSSSAPTDEVLVLSVSETSPPEGGGKIRLELRRTRRAQLGARHSSAGRTALDAALAHRPDKGEVFALAPDVDPDIVRGAAVPRWVEYVSQKGAARTAKQLRELLVKPGREELLAMYSDDVAEFSVAVGNDGISLAAARHLVLAADVGGLG